MSYNVNFDILETVVASAPVHQKLGPLIAAIASRTDMHSVANVTTREHFVPTPHRILDQIIECRRHGRVHGRGYTDAQCTA